MRVCDGFFYRGQKVAVIGGVTQPLRSAIPRKSGERRVSVHRRNQFRGEKILRDRVMAKENIHVIWDHTLAEVLGDDMGVTGMQICSTETEAYQSLMLAAYSSRSDTRRTPLFEGQLEMNNGYIMIQSGLGGGATSTSVPGLFAAVTLPIKFTDKR